MNQQPVNYFFTRSKDTHTELNSVYITLFVRLTKEYEDTDTRTKYKKIESLWVEIEELELMQAAKKLQSLPNGVRRYAVSEEVFDNLIQLAKRCPDELYYITPIYKLNNFRKFEETACE